MFTECFVYDYNELNEEYISFTEENNDLVIFFANMFYVAFSTTVSNKTKSCH